MNKSDTKTKPLCLAPLHSLRILANQRITPCCLTTHPNLTVGNQDGVEKILNHPGLKNHRKSMLKESLPTACKKCISREKAVNFSMRNIYDQIIETDHIQATEINFEHWDPMLITHLDLNFSFRCNLKCRMCSGYRSSLWMQDEKALNEKLSFRESVPETLHDAELSFEFYKNLIDACQNVRRIDIKGGEPLISKTSWQFLEYLVDANRAKDIQITFTTNGVTLPKKLKFLENFKRVEVTVSIEGVRRSYEYIRGFKTPFAQLEENLLAFDSLVNVRLQFNFTFQAYNVFEVVPVLDWLLTQAKRLTNFSKESIRLDHCILTTPEYLQATVLDPQTRIAAADKIKSSHLYGENRRILDPVLNYLTNFDLDHSHLLAQLRDFTRELDQIRGENVSMALPELAHVFRSPVRERPLSI